MCYSINWMCLVLLFCVLPCTNGKLQDWLISDFNIPSKLVKNNDNSYTLTNGLISRKFTTNPGFTTIDYYSHEKQTSILRALSPECVVKLDNITYNVGYINTSNIATRAYLNRTSLEATAKKDLTSFQYTGHSLVPIEAPYPYKPMRHAPNDIVWPPNGLRMDVQFTAPSESFVPDKHKGVIVTVHYQIYDGFPAMSKWVTISASNKLSMGVNASVLSVEILALNEPFSRISSWDGYTPAVDVPDNAYNWLHVDTNRGHGTQIHWQVDKSQPDSPGSYQPLLTVTSTDPPPVFALQEEDFVSFQVNELFHCASDPTRKALAVNRFLRLLAPQTYENPIFFHMTSTDTTQFHSTIDQLAEVGFEMIIFSFGSGFNLETNSLADILKWKKDIEYANSKGIEVGGYDLIVLDRGDLPGKYRVIDKNGQGTGNACLASEWYDIISEKIFNFIEQTNLTMIETDGPYGGSTCYSSTHKYHDGHEDSIYKQNLLQERIYKELRKKNIYINMPDVYYYAGGNRNGLGYNENQYSLPRWEDLSVSRQTMFDRLYTVPPTAGWMFLPLVQYHGGGDAATFEPLSDNFKEYGFGLGQYLGAGVAAFYRGYRIFDSEETKALVKKWVDFYKKYRPIVISDVVRIKRPDMQGIDAFMHVNYKLDVKGLVMVFNPTLSKISTTLSVPMYYTGLKNKVAISREENEFQNYDLDVGQFGWEVEIPVELGPQSITWYLLKEAISEN